MSPLQGARPDLALRLRHRQRSLKNRLTRPETHLALLRAAHATVHAEQIGELLLDHAQEWLPITSCAVINANHAGQLLVLAGRSLTQGSTAVAVQLAQCVLRTGQEFVTPDCRRDPRIDGPCGAALALPLRSRQRITGALVVMDQQPASAEPRLSPEVLDLLTLALEGPSVALDNALRLQRAESLSVTDDLTQLYNSRYLNLALRREAKRVSRHGRPLSLLFIDLDGFKHVNDTHGHLAGSRALVEAARVIRSSARETDVVARFGGDEFAVILPDTGSDGASAMGERLRERIAAHSFLAPEGLVVRLTASVGVATLPDAALTAEELIMAADAAMYRVKDAGKNAVSVASGRRAAN